MKALSRLPRVTFPAAATALLTSLSFAILADNLARQIQGLSLAFNLQVVAASALCAWLFAQIRRRWAGVAMGLAGVIFLVLTLSQVFLRSLVLGLSVFDRVHPLTNNLTQPASAPDGIAFALAQLINSLAVLVARIVDWALGFFHGSAYFDPLAVTFCWGLALWLAAGWGAWALARRHSAVSALLPSLSLLGVTLWYVRAPAVPILFLLGCFLLLVISSTVSWRERAWQAEGRDFSTEIRFDTTVSTVPLVLLIFGAAALIPSLSIHTISDFIRDLTTRPSQSGGSIPGSFGLRPPPAPAAAFDRRRSPGLPQSHLIGSGPELSSRVVMTIRTDDLPPVGYGQANTGVPRHYWRGFTYDLYTGRGWIATGTETTTYQPRETTGLTPGSNFRLLHQTVTGDEDLQGVLYASGRLVSADPGFTLVWRAQQDAFTATIGANSYQASSLIPTYRPTNLKNTGRDYPAWIRDHYTSLPDSVPTRVRDLARSITAEALTPYDQARAIEAYLREIPYTLDLPAPPQDQDVVDYFLFTLKKGYCDYDATAMVVLARAVGLPARLVVGYASGKFDPGSGQYVVTEEDAHSWPEIYFPGYEWVEFEPTGGLEPVGSNSTEAAAAPIETTKNTPATSTFTLHNLRIPWGGVGLSLSMGALVLLLAMRLTQEIRTHKQSPSALDYLYSQLAQKGRRVGIDPSPADTPHELAERLALSLARRGTSRGESSVSEDFRRFADLFGRSIYSRSPLSPQDYKALRRLWRRLLNRLDRARLYDLLHKSRL